MTDRYPPNSISPGQFSSLFFHSPIVKNAREEEFDRLPDFSAKKNKTERQENSDISHKETFVALRRNRKAPKEAESACDQLIFSIAIDDANAVDVAAVVGAAVSFAAAKVAVASWESISAYVGRVVKRTIRPKFLSGQTFFVSLSPGTSN